MRRLLQAFLTARRPPSHQGWRIDRGTASELGIPRGLPYLTGWVTHFAMLDEMAD